jgi:hypothetical protein
MWARFSMSRRALRARYKVAAAAGRVEYAVVVEAEQEALVGRPGSLALPAFRAVAKARG